jgi:hypothetical protein
MFNRSPPSLAAQQVSSVEFPGMQANVFCALLTTGALAFAAGPAIGQDAPRADATNAILVPDTTLTPEESALLGNALVFDPSVLAEAPKKPLRIPSDKGYAVTRTDKTDGSGTFVVKQPLQTDWSNSIGADLGPSRGGSAFDRPFPTTRNDSPSGSAWASVGLANIGSMDARIDPTNEQGKFGTTLKQSIPFGGRFAVTLQDTYSVTEMRGQSMAGPNDIPLMALPAASTPLTPQVFGNERSVKFNILPTGTTLGAGQTSASNDPVAHNTLSAEQKLYGPLQVTTAVTDFGQTTSGKSVSAGFKLHW